VAKAWCDEAFKQRLLANAAAAAAELGINATNSTTPTVLKVAEAAQCTEAPPGVAFY
jgi:hypothetical protein